MMADGPKELRIYSTADGKRPFQEWIESLKDGEAQARILVRLERVRWAIWAIANRSVRAFTNYGSR